MMFTSKSVLALLLGTSLAAPFVSAQGEERLARNKKRSLRHGESGHGEGGHQSGGSGSRRINIQDDDIRSIDGSENPRGAANAVLMRLTHAVYVDGEGAMDPLDPSARMISNIVSDNADEPILADSASDFLWVWGQFLDHDIDLSGESEEETDVFTIMSDDCGNDIICSISFTRSEGEIHNGKRQQINLITSFIDGSMVYGSDLDRANALRGDDGRLLVSEGNFLPFNEHGLVNAAPTGSDASDFFLAGDIRANEQLGLTSMHTLFVREHNRLVDILESAFPESDSHNLYEMARKLVGAAIQRITYSEFLPELLGRDAPVVRDFEEYRSDHYRSDINPAIANEFSTVAFRVGHTMLSSEFTIGPTETLLLEDAFFHPEYLTRANPDMMAHLFGGYCTSQAQQVDPLVIDDVRNHLFGEHVAGVGIDLVSLNIQRGRDHGIPKYTELRKELGLREVESFSDITRNEDMQDKLSLAYGGSVDRIDAWIGGLAEDHVEGAMVGPLFHHIISNQFERLMFGDKFFYKRDRVLRDYESQLRDLGIDYKEVTFADILRNNVGLLIDHHKSVMSMGAQTEINNVI